MEKFSFCFIRNNIPNPGASSSWTSVGSAGDLNNTHAIRYVDASPVYNAGYNNGKSDGVSETKQGNADKAQVLEGFTFTSATAGVNQSGTMEDKGTQTYGSGIKGAGLTTVYEGNGHFTKIVFDSAPAYNAGWDAYGEWIKANCRSIVAEDPNTYCTGTHQHTSDNWDESSTYSSWRRCHCPVCGSEEDYDEDNGVSPHFARVSGYFISLNDLP